MPTRDWIELREINGKTFVVKCYEVDTHESFTVRSFNILREADVEDTEKYKNTSEKRSSFEK